VSTGIHLEHDWFPRALPANVSIAERSWCYSAFAFIHCRSRRSCAVRIGHDTGVYDGTFFELGANGEVIIGDYCTLVGAIIATNRRVMIEDYAFVSHEVLIVDDASMIPASADTLSAASEGGITIGRNSWIGARAILIANANIGEGAIVGAGAVVGGDVPPFTVAAGNPARIVRPAQR
jgi:acetyltransferase-like isoleucine patch superfamily enzyme